MPQHAAHRFLQSLSPAAQQALLGLRQLATEPPAADAVPWWYGEQALGYLSPVRAQYLHQALGDTQWQARGLVWSADAAPFKVRSERLQAVLERARAQGLLPGWRGERFAFWHRDCLNPESDTAPLFAVERSGFRWLGLLSHAVHVNGFLPDGRLWVARRAWNKATDPGLLDNVTAGGLPWGESVLQCLRRELAEEAGLQQWPASALQAAGPVRTSRHEPEGWHDEVLHVFNLRLEDGWTPCNTDGEVAGFMCLHAEAVLAGIEAGEWTRDAVQALVQGLPFAPV